jgi:hypothetical protein
MEADINSTGMMAEGVAFQPFLYYPQKMSVLFSPPFSFIVGSSPCCGNLKYKF